MSLGLSNVVNLYYKRYVNQQNKAVNHNNSIDFSSTLSARKAENMSMAQATEETGTSKVDAYTEYLKSRYGNVMIQDVGKDQKSMDALGASTFGHNNVVIAPNILEKMANNPKKAAYYENKIQMGLDNYPKCQAQLSAMGHEIYSYGVVVHSDGTVYTYVCGDLKPEVRAKIEAKVKAEQEEKAKRKQHYLELSEEAAEKRRTEMKISNAKQTMEEAVKSRITDSKVSPQFFTFDVTAYDKNFMYVSGNRITFLH